MNRGKTGPENATNLFMNPVTSTGFPFIIAVVAGTRDLRGAHFRHECALEQRQLLGARLRGEARERRAGTERRERDAGAAKLARDRLAEAQDV